MSDPSCRVVVVDDHELYRRGLVASLREFGWLEIAGEAASGREAIEVARRLEPDVVVMDLEMPGMGGLEATRHILQERPSTAVLVVTAIDDHEKVVEALVAGVAGYVLKDADPADVADAIAAARRGESMLSPRVTRALVARVREAAPVADEGPAPGLSERESEVLRLMVKGAGNQEIAATLFISENTVKRHVSSVLDKLGAANRVQAVVAALRRGVI